MLKIYEVKGIKYIPLSVIYDIKSDINKLTRYQITEKTEVISKRAVDRVFNLHLYGSRDGNGKEAIL